jgi:hypothetical protein
MTNDLRPNEDLDAAFTADARPKEQRRHAARKAWQTRRRKAEEAGDVFLGHTGEPAASRKLPKGRRKRSPGDRDAVRRRAFKVLALLADLDAKERAKVLQAAARLNRA